MEPNKHPGFSFSVSADYHFTIEQIWPDGDAPENPTAQDVAKVVEDCGGVLAVFADWDLEDGIQLHVGGPDDAVDLHD